MYSIIELLNFRKIIYVALSIVYVVCIYLLEEYVLISESALTMVFLLATIIFLGMILSSVYLLVPNYSKAVTLFLPMQLALSHLLLNFYFPNLGIVINFLGYLGLFVACYIFFLLGNVFFIVSKKGSTIPLYSAAVTWVHILIVVVSILFISGLSKTSLGFLAQNTVILIFTFLTNLYFIWAVMFDSQIRRIARTDRVVLAVVLGFLTFVSGLSVSFLPTEAFLRAIFISSIVMFNLTYIYGYLKNRLNIRNVVEHVVISAICLSILLIFRP